MSETNDKIKKELAEVRKLLDLLESYAAWQIRATARFKVGQRVEFSRKAKERRIAQRRRLVKRGTVLKVEPFSVSVKIDGENRPRNYQHSFFNPISGPKLF